MSFISELTRREVGHMLEGSVRTDGKRVAGLRF